MAVKKRGKSLFIDFRPFREDRIGVKVNVDTKTEAKMIEASVLRACRSGDYGSLDSISRETCVRMFENQRWEIPSDLSGRILPTEELTLWKACEVFFKYPEIKQSRERERYLQCTVHLVKFFGKNRPVKGIWIPDIKHYVVKRIGDGASAATINREKGTLSKLYQVLVELQFVEANPCRLVKSLTQKTEERHAYLSLETVSTIAARCPTWYQPIIWTAYYTGMRRGEILGLTRKQVNPSNRIITLSPGDTKEVHWKRVPIHGDLVSILRAVLEGPSLLSGRVFPLRDAKGIRDLELESFKNVWPRACEALDLEEPHPRFHDLRHTWRTNARRSGMSDQIAESIMGHWFKGKSVNDRYGHVSDEELVQAIDRMTFDHGETKILVARSRSPKNGDKMDTNEGFKRKRSCGNMT